MQPMEQTAHHVVLVRDGAGQIVHTHEVIYFQGADELDDGQLKAEALAAAERTHSQNDKLVATVSSNDELVRIRNETRQRRHK
jgi:hypothetical protein